MLFAGIFFVLLILELFYFKIAEFFNITDHPNQRGSHQVVTLRGGGIIFPVSVLLYLAVFGFVYGYFVLGLLLIATICFADDIKPQRRRIRALVQFISIFLLLYEVELVYYLWLLLPALFIVFAMINAYNFMDGINGMTAGYSLTILAALYFINMELHAFDHYLLFCVAIANIIFGWFNFRPNAKFFAGDVGSISMAFILMFMTLSCIVAASNPIFFLFYLLYIVDVGATIIQRLYQRDNVFEPHRKHLFQYLANEKKFSHVWVSTAYMLIQVLISAGVLIVWEKDSSIQWAYTIIVIGIVSLSYFLVKYKLLKQIRSVGSIA